MIGYCRGSGEITDKLGPRPSYQATDERSAALLQGGDNIVAIRPIREASPDPRYLVVESRQSGRIAYWPVLYEMVDLRAHEIAFRSNLDVCGVPRGSLASIGEGYETSTLRRKRCRRTQQIGRAHVRTPVTNAHLV